MSVSKKLAAGPGARFIRVFALVAGVRLFEYEGKELFSRYEIPVPRSRLVEDSAGVLSAVDEIGLPAVIKAQVLSGGRGKAGGISTVRSREEATSEAARILALKIGGEATRSILVEEAVEHSSELYLSVSLDREQRCFVALASGAGGMEVESASRGRWARTAVPLEGLSAVAAATVVEELGLEARASLSCLRILLALERLSREEECELAEINPLAVCPDGRLVALDSKLVLDDNALYRHPEFSRLPPEDPFEGEAARSGFAFVRLAGNVAVVGNGAGLVMSTLDAVVDAGGSPACFLDLGGGAERARVEAALALVGRLPGARAVLVNVFGGITDTVEVAEGVVGSKSAGLTIPVYVRIRGPDEEQARGVLSASGVPSFLSTQEAVASAIGGVSH